MYIKIIKITLLIVIIPLFLAGCGKGSRNDTGDTPTTLPATLKIKRSSKTYVITGFGSSGSIRAAIINDQVVVPGMELDPGVVLSEICPTYAVIKHGNTEYRIRPEVMQDELDKKRR